MKWPFADDELGEPDRKVDRARALAGKIRSGDYGERDLVEVMKMLDPGENGGNECPMTAASLLYAIAWRWAVQEYKRKASK